MVEDPLTLAQVQMLALWLREDDRDTVRAEAASIMDPLLGLYCQQDDVRTPVLEVLQQLLLDENNIDSFLHYKGWETLIYDLRSIIKAPSMPEQTRYCGLVIADILGSVASHAIKLSTASRHWIDFVRVAGTLDAKGSSETLEMQSNIALLAIQLYLENRTNDRKGHGLRQLLQSSKRLLIAGDKLDKATRDNLEEAVKMLNFS